MVTIIACGNLLRGDDGVGPRVLEELARSGIPDEVALIDAGTAALDILCYMEHANRIIVVDAVTSGNPPGTIYRIPIDDFEPAVDHLTLHALAPQDVLAIGRKMFGMGLVASVIIFGVEVATTQTGLGLSPQVEEAVPRLVNLVRHEIAGQGEP